MENWKYARTKVNAILMTSLVFVFLILWLPTITLEMYDNYKINEYLSDLNKLIFFINSGVNAFLYAVTRKIYRNSFKFLLTTSPWKWRELPRWLLKLKSKSSFSTDPVIVKLGNITQPNELNKLDHSSLKTTSVALDPLCHSSSV